MIIEAAYAQEAAQQPGALVQFLPLIILAAVFYFLLVRPQLKRNREHREMVAALAVGDEVVTGGGIMGRVLEVHESHVLLDLGDSKVRFQKQSVQNILPKGTL